MHRCSGPLRAPAGHCVPGCPYRPLKPILDVSSRPRSPKNTAILHMHAISLAKAIHCCRLKRHLCRWSVSGRPRRLVATVAFCTCSLSHVGRPGCIYHASTRSPVPKRIQPPVSASALPHRQTQLQFNRGSGQHSHSTVPRLGHLFALTIPQPSPSAVRAPPVDRHVPVDI